MGAPSMSKRCMSQINSLHNQTIAFDKNLNRSKMRATDKSSQPIGPAVKTLPPISKRIAPPRAMKDPMKNNVISV